MAHRPVRDVVHADDRPPEVHRGDQERQVHEVHEPHVAHGQAQRRRQEEGEHPDVVHGGGRDRMAPPAERLGIEDPEQPDLDRSARRLQGEGHGGTEGEQRRCRDHQQEMLDHVGFEVAHRERGHRRLQGQIDHHQSGEERRRAPAAPGPSLRRQCPGRLHIPDTHHQDGDQCQDGERPGVPLGHQVVQRDCDAVATVQSRRHERVQFLVATAPSLPKRPPGSHSRGPPGSASCRERPGRPGTTG